MNSHEVNELVKGFEEGSWPAAQWTHQCHVYMGLWYIRNFPLREVKNRIKEGIKKYNLSQGGENTDTSGYHETITEFYIRILDIYLKNLVILDEEEFWRGVKTQPFMDKDYPFQYYSQSHLMSKKARAVWCEPDLLPIKVYESTPPA